MSIQANKPYSAPRPAEYAPIPEPIFRKSWYKDLNLPGPNPKFSDLITATFMINTPKFLLGMQRKFGDNCSFFLSRRGFANKIEKTYSFQNLGDDDSTIQRLSFYQKSISLFNENPLYGHGLGSWKYKSLQNDNTENKKILVPYYAHNDFLQTLMEMGIIGLLIYLIFFLLLRNHQLNYQLHLA